MKIGDEPRQGNVERFGDRAQPDEGARVVAAPLEHG